MVKKILAAAVASVLTVGMFASCGKKSADDGSKSENVESTITETVDIMKGASEKMLERSILLEGDTSRLAEKLNNALVNSKQMTNICFLGDSITQGSAAEQSNNQYVNRFKTWWEENVSYYVDVTNAGIGATDSYIGVHRVQKDVLDLKPDIIFIEFINDTDDFFYKTCMDSLRGNVWNRRIILRLL